VYGASDVTAHEDATTLESRIEEWRCHVGRSRAITAADVDELEDHLREQIERLQDAGLSDDEAFIVGIRRMGNLDAVAREFARAHSDRLWTQLVIGNANDDGRSTHAVATVTFVLALTAAVCVTMPGALGMSLHGWPRSSQVSFVILPLLAGYFAWKRRVRVATVLSIAGLFLLAGVTVTVPAFVPEAETGWLARAHLPAALLPLVGWAYAEGRWWHATAHIDFVRFLGEFVVYYLLIAAGGGLVVASVAGIARVAGTRAELELWLLPAMAAAAVFLATWLVEAKRGAVESLAPVLTRLFSPLLVVLLFGLLASVVANGASVEADRGLGRTLLMLGVAEAFVLVAASARGTQAPPAAADAVQVALVSMALLVDAVALSELLRHIQDGGLTATRAAAVGLHVVLLVHLAGAALLYVGFMRGRVVFTRLERWHACAMTASTTWAAVVVLVLPPVFAYR
jgi:hypothetical protein